MGHLGHHPPRLTSKVAISADFRRKLLEERNEARGDTRLKARFLSYRLNLPSADESTLLLDVVADWGPNDPKGAVASNGSADCRYRPGRRAGVVCGSSGMGQWAD